MARHVPGTYSAGEVSPEALASVRATVAAVGAKLGVAQPRDWASVRVEDFRKAGGSVVLRQFGHSLTALLEATFPAGEMAELRKRRQGHWEAAENRRSFVRELARKMGLRTPADWRAVSYRDFAARGGAGVLSKTGGSVHTALLETFAPREEDKEEWAAELCRPQVPRGHWEAEENVRRLMERIRSRHRPQSLDDWMRISKEQLHELHGAGLLQVMSLAEAVLLAFPDEAWGTSAGREGFAKKASQRHLKVVLATIFSQEPRT